MRTYGFARPLKPSDVKPGMLIAAQWDGRKVVGLAFESEHEVQVAIFDDNGEQQPEPPYVLDLSDIQSSIVAIPGEREIVPAEGDASFALLPNRRTLEEGLVICSDGRVAIFVTHHEHGRKKSHLLDLGTGEQISGVSQMACLPDWRLFVIEEGRKTRKRVSASA